MDTHRISIAFLLLIALNWVTGGAYGRRELNEGGLPAVPPKPAEMTITFFMHDVVGGPNPTANPLIAGGLPLAGVPFPSATNEPLPFPSAVPFYNAGRPSQFHLNTVFNSFSNGQIPFNNPINGPFQFQFPLPIDSPINSPFQFSQSPVLPLSDGQIPFGRPFPFPIPDALPNTFASGAVPVNKGYGGVILIDDALTEGPDHSSALLGKGQGYYAPNGEDATTLFLSFTAKFEDAQYEGSTIEFCGIDNTALHQREIAVVGGSGKFHNAQGHAIIETVSNNDLETVLKFTVNLTY